MKKETVPESEQERQQRHTPEERGVGVFADTESGDHHQHQRQDPGIDAGLPEIPVCPGPPVIAPRSAGGPE